MKGQRNPKKPNEKAFKQWIGALFKQLRSETGLTQSEVAFIGGFENRYYSRLETGNYIPHIDTLLLVLGALGYEGITFIINREEGNYGYYVLGESCFRKKQG